jgi:streptogramin lyase
MSKRTLLVCALSVLVALSAAAGSFERFSLPRTRAAEGRLIAAGPSYAWVLTYPESRLVRVGTDGATQAVFPPVIPATALAFDPTDGGVWYANESKVGHLTPAGVKQEWQFPGSYMGQAREIVIGPGNDIWIAFDFAVGAVDRGSGQMARFDQASGSSGMTVGPDGNLWLAMGWRDAIGRLTPTGTFTLFEEAGLAPDRIAAGADGKLWFTTAAGTARSISTSGVFSQTFAGDSSDRIVAGTDGRLWWNQSTPALAKWVPGAASIESTFQLGAENVAVTALSASTSGVWWGSVGEKLGRVSYTGESEQWPFTPLAPDAHALVTFADAVWFTAPLSNQIGRMTADGTTTLYDLPHEDSEPYGITAGPDGALWFTEKSGDRIGRIDAAGTITEFDLPTLDGEPYGIATGADGNLWITLASADKIVRLTPAGVATEFPVPGGNSRPTSIAAGPGGSLFFTEWFGFQIGRITTAGVITERNAGGPTPLGIVAGPDGNLWYGTNAGLHRMPPGGGPATLVVPGFALAEQRIVGPDGALWSNSPNGLQRTTLDGTSHLFSGAPTGSGITVGPDGKIWITDDDRQSIARMHDDQPVTGTGRSLCVQSNGNVFGVLATFVDPDRRPSDEYSARIYWSDTDWSAGVIGEADPGKYDVLGSHDYSWAESMPLRVTFTALPGEDRIGGTYAVTANLVASELVPGTVDVPRDGIVSSVPVNGLTGCGWQAASTVSWITFPNGNSGTGSGALHYSVARNNGFSARQGTIDVGERTLTIRQAAAGGTGLYLVTPCRLYDSRNTSSQIGAGAEWQISTVGSCGIPPDARALVANITAITPANDGWLAVYRTGEPWPGVSTLNYRPGKTRANNALIPMFDAAFLIRNGGVAPVDFIVDVTGYFK